MTAEPWDVEDYADECGWHGVVEDDGTRAIIEQAGEPDEGHREWVGTNTVDDSVTETEHPRVVPRFLHDRAVLQEAIGTRGQGGEEASALWWGLWKALVSGESANDVLAVTGRPWCTMHTGVVSTAITGIIAGLDEVRSAALRTDPPVRQFSAGPSEATWTAEPVPLHGDGGIVLDAVLTCLTVVIGALDWCIFDDHAHWLSVRRILHPGTRSRGTQ